MHPFFDVKAVLGDSYLIQLLRCKDLPVVAFCKQSLDFLRVSMQMTVCFHNNWHDMLTAIQDMCTVLSVCPQLY